MDAKQAKALRDPFPASVIGKLPKPYKKDSPKGNCPECGGYHGLPAVHLDYVGHAAATDRLLKVDPCWTWEPLGLDEYGLPAIDKGGNLWIRLTIAGVTRIGCGDGASMKERIGDAIRNAAMRFGVALDLWAKEDLHEIAQGTAEPVVVSTPAQASEADPQTSVEPPATTRMSRGTAKAITPQQSAHMFALFGERGITDRDARLAGISKVVGRTVESSKDLSTREAALVITSLKPADTEEPPQ